MQKYLLRLVSLVLIAGLLFSPAIAQTPQPGLETYQFQPVDKYGLTEAELAWVAEVQRVDGFIIQLEEPSLATYKGGNGVFAAPERNSAGKIDITSDAAVAYLAHLNKQLDGAIQSSERFIGRDLEVYARFDVVLNGFAAKMSPTEAAALRQMEGVREVYPDLLWQPDTDTSPEFLGVDGIWDGTSVPGGEGATGEGVLVGILDTGINMDHPSFAEVGPVDEYVHTNPFGTGVYKGLCASDPTNYVCNDKLVGVYAYVDEPIVGEDASDHGSHTASTAAGNVVEFDFSGANVTISGMAPHANIIAYDVCDDDGCPNSATASAVGQAVVNGVDVLNYSIGPSSGPGQSPYVSASEVAFLEAVDAGIITATSAGNSGNGVSTTYKAAPWTLIVGNTNHGRIFGNPVIVNPGDATEVTAISLPHAGQALLEDLVDVPFIWGGVDDPAYDTGCEAFPADYFTDSVALLTRGGCTFDVKITNAQNAGAIAVVVRNNAPGAPIVMGLSEDPPTLVNIPGGMVSKDDGDAMVALAEAGMTVTLLADYGSQNEPAWGDVLNQSSSRGPFTLADVLVPEIVAPGTNVLAAYDSQGPDTEYGLMSGTSMASPHAAGSLALMTELFPDWSPAERKSALMMTALPGTTKDFDFTAVDAFDYGNGRLDMSKAALTGLVMAETYEGFLAADPAEGGDVRDLNIPSYQNTYCVGICSFERTFTSVADVAVTYTLDLTADETLVVDVQPAEFTIEPGATQTITVEIDADAAESELWVFGRIAYTTEETWETGEAISDVAIPFAVRPFPSSMPTFVEAETMRDQGATVVTEVQSKAITEFTAVKSGLVPGTDEVFTLLPDATNGDPFDDLSQVWWKTFTLTEDADRLVMEILDTTAGDIDMFFGVGEVPDEDMIVATSATATALEYISVTGIPAGLPLWVLIQNWEGAPAGDMIKYTEAVIYPEDAGNWDITGPESVDALEPYDVTISWNIPGMPTPSAWYGMFSILASPEATDPISTTEFNLYRTGDDVEKSVSQTSARKGDIVTYEILVNPNYGDTDLTYEIEDVLPVEVEIVDGSLVVIGSDSLATYDAATRTIAWTGVVPPVNNNYLISDNLTDPSCGMPLGDGGYINLKDYGINPNPGISGDGSVWQYGGVGLNMSWFGGRTSEPPIFVDDGHAYMNGSFNDDNYWMWETQEFPNPLAPNDVMAAFMTDIDFVYDAALVKGVSAATLGGGAAWVVEYDDVFPWGNPSNTMDLEFFAWTDADPAPTGADIMFAFDNVVGDWSGYNTIGLENADGSVGATYQYDGPTPTNDLVVCFDYAPSGVEPIIIRFDAVVVTNEVDIDVVNTASHDNDALNTEFEETNEAVFHVGTVAVDDFYATALNTELVVAAPGVLENDMPGSPADNLFADIKTEPQHGTLILNQDGSFSYIPDEGFFGTDSFEYYLLSLPGIMGSYTDWATVTIEVGGLNTYLPIMFK
ncbi:MAG: S8 family serine peptidase [Anaerolineaceae bacterium]|nr:S8 family serine peptidase [Anaerolineaceae bacterium]